MGAWGSGYFENDGALDALAELADDPTIERLIAIFAADAEDYIETDHAEAIIAAASVLAIAAGAIPATDDPRLAPILAALGQPSGDIKMRAATALERVLGASETAELWADADPQDNKAWREGLTTMIAKLRV